MKQFIDEKIERDVMFVLRAEMNTLHLSLLELTRRVDRIDERTQVVHYAVINHADNIEQLPKTEARVAAVETVSRRHTREIQVLQAVVPN